MKQQINNFKTSIIKSGRELYQLRKKRERLALKRRVVRNSRQIRESLIG